jgi:hypothetical protein
MSTPTLAVSSHSGTKPTRFFSIKNLKSSDVVEIDPRTVKPAPLFVDSAGEPDKQKFRKWCADSSTDHCFYNQVEGLIPATRVTKENPPVFLHGFTADYDAEQTKEEVKTFTAKNAAHMPRWISTTFSGGVRLTWEFEEPVAVDQPELAAAFMKELRRELDVDKCAIAFDDGSLKLGKYFEAGRNWEDLGGKPISSKVLSAVFFRAANKAKIQGDSIIPIEDVAAEIESRWPGRADITVGARVPLFWVEPFEDRVGAQVGDYGMICYSTRAGKSFLSWSDIFGPEFIKNYQAERIGNAVDGLYFDGRFYWQQVDGIWRKRNVEETIRRLKAQGICPRPIKGSGFASEADLVILAAQQRNEVKAAAPIVHDSRRIVVINGEKYLNISAIKIMQPAEHGEPANFPWLHEFLLKCWDEKHPEQQDSFLGWFQHFYVPCLEGRPQQGQAIIIAGEPSRGKTFLNYHILGRAMGGFSDATDFLMGGSNFNKADSEVALWAIDDTRGGASWENRAAFTGALKKHVANPIVRCEGKHRRIRKISGSTSWRTDRHLARQRCPNFQSEDQVRQIGNGGVDDWK